MRTKSNSNIDIVAGGSEVASGVSYNLDEGPYNVQKPLPLSNSDNDKIILIGLGDIQITKGSGARIITMNVSIIQDDNALSDFGDTLENEYLSDKVDSKRITFTVVNEADADWLEIGDTVIVESEIHNILKGPYIVIQAENEMVSKNGKYMVSKVVGARPFMEKASIQMNVSGVALVDTSDTPYKDPVSMNKLLTGQVPKWDVDAGTGNYGTRAIDYTAAIIAGEGAFYLGKFIK